MHMPAQFRLCASADAAAATFLAVSRLIGSPYGVFGCASGTFSFGLFGSAGTRAKAPVLISSAAQNALAIIIMRFIDNLPGKRRCSGIAPAYWAGLLTRPSLA